MMRYKNVNITIVRGTANSIHSKKVIFVPARFCIKPIPIRFGGVPMGVAMPPTDAPYAIISIIPVAYLLPMIGEVPPASLWSSSIAFSTPSVMGSIIAVAAVLLIHMEIIADIAPQAKRTL
ncbi:MAG: hypothetical protein A2056_02380 [Deltaproteobacteria bacterium GWA2_42_85]|nr:MAG: hypothetical protein A2056_02380 [Deltaproteobacteria bacterium GWA2_42_85]